MPSIQHPLKDCFTNVNLAIPWMNMYLTLPLVVQDKEYYHCIVITSFIPWQWSDWSTVRMGLAIQNSLIENGCGSISLSVCARRAQFVMVAFRRSVIFMLFLNPVVLSSYLSSSNIAIFVSFFHNLAQLAANEDRSTIRSQRNKQNKIAYSL